MSPQDIRICVDAINAQLEEKLKAHVGQFILNPEVYALYDKLHKLQEQCPHMYDDKGVCIFCNKVK